MGLKFGDFFVLLLSIDYIMYLHTVFLLNRFWFLGFFLVLVGGLPKPCNSE